MKKAVIAIGIFVLLFAPALTVAESERQIDDIKLLQGTWRGDWKSPRTGAMTRIHMHVKEDGSYEAVGTGAGSYIVQGKLTVQDGQVLYQSGQSAGSAKLYSDRGKDILKLMRSDGTVGMEYERVK